MRKSSSKSDRDDELPPVDYSKLPKEIEDVVEHEKRVIKKESKLTNDGRQFLVRIPKDVKRIMKIDKDYVMSFEMQMPLPKTNDKPQLSIKLVRGSE